MKLSLNRIGPNPFRDFNIDPIDDERVERLTQSIKDHDFWNGLLVREYPKGKYHLIFGHHRLAAAKAAGIKSIDVPVVKWDDDQTLQAMGAENGTQRGENISACNNDVAAAMRRIGYILLTHDECPEQVSKIFETSASWNSAKGKFLAGEGLGEGLINKYYTGVLKAGDVKESVAELKASAKYAEITREVIDKAAAVHVYPEPEDLKTESDFNMLAAAVFKNTAQAKAFRVAVSGGRGKRHVPVEKQVDFAKQIRDEIIADKGPDSLTSKLVRDYTNNTLLSLDGYGKEERKKRNQADKRLAAAEQWKLLTLSIEKASSRARKLLELIDEGFSPEPFDEMLAVAFFDNEMKDLEGLLENVKQQLPINITQSNVAHISTKVLEHEKA